MNSTTNNVETSLVASQSVISDLSRVGDRPGSEDDSHLKDHIPITRFMPLNDFYM
jgi:hypothetical protein